MHDLASGMSNNLYLLTLSCKWLLGDHNGFNNNNVVMKTLTISCGSDTFCKRLVKPLGDVADKLKPEFDINFVC